MISINLLPRPKERVRRSLKPLGSAILCLASVIGLVWVLMTIEPRESPVVGLCRQMLAMATSPSDSLLVLTAKPDSRYTMCASYLLK